MKLFNISRCFIACALTMTSMSACASKTQSEKETTPETEIADTVSTDSKSLVVYYSRTGDNYAVGNISEGNTAIIAKMIADETGADLFEIQTVSPYPEDYTECTEVAKKELAENVRPEIKEDVDISEYDIVYIGYPVWWGEAPMPVFTFIDKHDWIGKTVIPFCTHEGSGLSGTQRIADSCKGATSREGLAIKGTIAQNERDKAKNSVKNWLNK